MEFCAFQRGDMDMNGIFSAGDSRIILRGAVGLEVFTDVQQYLGGINATGTITAADARQALRYSVGYD